MTEESHVSKVPRPHLETDLVKMIIIGVLFGMLFGLFTARFSGEAPDWVVWLLILTGIGVPIALVPFMERHIRLSALTLAESPHDRIQQVRDHLTETGRLLAELQDDLATRTTVLEQLQTDAEHYERLASLNKKQAEAIQELIGRQFSRQQRAGVWLQALFLMLAFLLGFVVNWLSVPMLNWIGSLF